MVFPTPPGPVNVSTRAPPRSNFPTSALACSRPISGVSSTGVPIGRVGEPSREAEPGAAAPARPTVQAAWRASRSAASRPRAAAS